MTTVQSTQELQYLGPVPSLVGFGVSLSCKAYEAGKWLVPTPLKPTVESVEKKVMEISKPYADIVTETAPKVLQTADKQVAEAVGYLQSSENAKAFTAARDNYLKFVEESIEKVKTSTKIDERLAGLITNVQQAVQQVRTSSWGAYQQSLERLTLAYGSLMEHPQVKSVLGRSHEAYEGVLARYMDAHSVVTKDARYSLLVQKGKELISWVQTTTPYKMVDPLVTPLIQKVSSTPTYKKVTDHLQPQTGAQGLSPTVGPTAPKAD